MSSRWYWWNWIEWFSVADATRIGMVVLTEPFDE